MEYSHTQRAPLHYLLDAVAVLQLLLAWWMWALPVVPYVLIGAAVIVAVLASSVRTLTVSDDGDRLAVRFGPLPLFGKSFRYDEMTAVASGKTALIDGWGIHYLPGRGWTYNLWGYDCVVIQFGERRVQIGSDDVENLVRFLEKRLA